MQLCVVFIALHAIGKDTCWVTNLKAATELLPLLAISLQIIWIA